MLSSKQTLTDFLKINEEIFFDCHIYDKGGVGFGKDKCNFFVIRAWKNLDESLQLTPSSSNTQSPTIKTDTFDLVRK